MRFQDVLDDIQQDLMPHRLCEYLHTLAVRVADFTRDCNVLGTSTAPTVRVTRLKLCEVTIAIMQTGMKLLGIQPLDKV